MNTFEFKSDLLLYLIKNSMNNILEKICLTVKLLKIFDIYLFCYLASNEKIAITHLLYAMELQTMCHLVVQDKVAEQHILGKYSNCKRFRDTMELLSSKNFIVFITVVIKQLSNVQQV